MSNDLFEDELRSRLHAAADAETGAFLPVDTASVVGAGRRAVRRRRLAAVGGTAALAALAALGAWVALAGSTPDAIQDVPATRTSAPASVTPSPTATGVVEARFEDGAGGSVVVALDMATGALSAGSVPTAGSPEPTGIGEVPTDRAEVTWGVVSPDPLVVAGVLPAGATSLLPVWSDVGAAPASNVAALDGSGYQAFAVRLDGEVAGTELTDVLWSDGAAVVAAPARVVPSAVVDGVLAFHDPELALFGIVQESGFLTTSTTDASPATGRPASLLSDSGEPTGAVHALLLPAEASEVSVDVAPDATVTSATSAVLPGGAGLVHMVRMATPSPPTAALIPQLHWTDADGRHDVGYGGFLRVPGTGEPIVIEGHTLDGALTVALFRAGGYAELDGSDLPAAGRLVECLPEGGAVCAALPDRAGDVVLLDVQGRELGGGAGWEQRTIPGTGVHVVLASPGRQGLAVARLRWTDPDGTVRTLGFE